MLRNKKGLIDEKLRMLMKILYPANDECGFEWWKLLCLVNF